MTFRCAAFFGGLAIYPAMGVDGLLGYFTARPRCQLVVP